MNYELLNIGYKKQKIIEKFDNMNIKECQTDISINQPEVVNQPKVAQKNVEHPEVIQKNAEQQKVTQKNTNDNYVINNNINIQYYV